MRLCLIGDFSGTPDEGMKNVSHSTYEFLSQAHNVMALIPRNIFKQGTIKRLKQFNPSIIHYLHGPTFRSLALLKAMKFITGPDVKTIVSATRPYFSRLTRKMVPFLAPDLILTQSLKFETFFKNLGCNVNFFPNGVDLNKFSAVDTKTKMRLRRELGFPMDKKIILHVGHIKSNRKLDFFIKVQNMTEIQVVVAGGTHEKSDEALKERLINAGIIVIHKYLKDISILYKASDLYLFPIKDLKTTLPDDYNQIGAIDLPLSILEAMGCNLPVLSTRFGALPRLFKARNGFAYADNKADMIKKILPMTRIKNPGTRRMVKPLDWPKIIKALEIRYRRVMEKSGSDQNSGVSQGSMKEKEILQ